MGRLAELLEDHDLLLTALGDTPLWEELLAAELDGRAVRAAQVAPVGTGQVASCLRVELDHDAPGAPRALVAKVGSSDPVSRATSAMLRHGEIEVGWYRELAAGTLVRTPAVWGAEVRDDGSDFVIVLSAVDDSTPADQIAGMDPETAGLAVDELAALHASSWGGEPATTGTWLTDRGDPSAHSTLLAMLLPGFLERYAGDLAPEVLDAARELVGRGADYLGHRPGARSLVHGDFRPDNLLVGPAGVTVLDWQTVTMGPALADVAYFLSGALLPAARRDHEVALLDRYRAELAGRGVEIGAKEVDDGYRRYALDGLVMAIGASQVVGRTERGDEMFCAMAERSADLAAACGTFELF